MMKQVLLRITGVFAEIGFRKFTEPLCRDLLLAREITLSQNPLDPDVDWECVQPLVGKEHHAICDLGSHAGQRAYVISKLAIGKRRPCFEITFAGPDELRSGAQAFGAITERAFTQLPLGSSRNPLRGRKGMDHVAIDMTPSTEAVP